MIFSIAGSWAVGRLLASRPSICALRPYLVHAHSDEERQRVAVLLTRHKAEYERIQQASKDAALQQRRRAAQSAANERKELLAGAADPAAKQRALQTQAELVTASQGVTEGLRRTRQVLAEVSGEVPLAAGCRYGLG
jgi:hypothetical protein